jgi:hypothetical protein
MLALTAAAPHAKSAYFLDGNDLLAKCQSGNWQDRSFCLGYIEGVVDNLTENRASNGLEGCPNGDIIAKTGQGRGGECTNG